ncbi:MAG: helix-turn-helix domain-containing protein [Hungatella sp.]|nr:helix-turn-helix domain-containing protein [Hungatella sp.]
MIAGRIRQIRKRRKLSQKKLSEKSGVSLGSVKRFEDVPPT